MSNFGEEVLISDLKMVANKLKPFSTAFISVTVDSESKVNRFENSSRLH
jgi:hypothetical protein